MQKPAKQLNNLMRRNKAGQTFLNKSSEGRNPGNKNALTVWIDLRQKKYLLLLMA